MQQTPAAASNRAHWRQFQQLEDPNYPILIESVGGCTCLDGLPRRAGGFQRRDEIGDGFGLEGGAILPRAAPHCRDAIGCRPG